MLKAHPGQHMCCSTGGRTSLVPIYMYTYNGAQGAASMVLIVAFKSWTTCTSVSGCHTPVPH